MSELQPSTGGRRRLSAGDLALVEDIFTEALDVSASSQPVFVAERCGSRVDLRAEIEALLAAHRRADAVLRPAGDGSAADVGPTGSWSGSVIGQYRCIEKIGEGGMGDVYLAERADGLFAHKVAVKVMRASVRDADSGRRFRAERQILASLHHPNIVTLLDGGATPDGQAYLVMEHVDGVPITAYCRERAVALEARLELLCQACRAVQYAHQHGIVHRDLKPANILVTSEGVPKVLDFGVSKLLETSGTERGTVPGLFPGPLTPNYASPEQVRGLPVTTACDVYSLGVLAYEVIAGVRPYETTGKTLDEVIEIVMKTDPARPSTARTGDSRTPDNSAYSRGRLKGDLDAIVLKAMSKEPERRYGSAGELAGDLERFLTGQPVVAREPSVGYVLRRLARRNKLVVGVAAASLVAIVGALGVALNQRARAEQRFNETRQLANALIFKIHDAVAPLPGSTPVRQIIVKEALAYLERLEAESANDESIRLELSTAYQKIGAILGAPNSPNLGDRAGALEQFERARNLALPLASRANASPTALVAMVDVDRLLSGLLAVQGNRARALEFAREGVDYAERRQRQAPRDNAARELLAKATFNLAFAVGGEEALPHWRRAGELFEAALAEKPGDPQRQRNVALVEKYVGAVLDVLDRDIEALPHYRRALELDEQRYARDPGNRLVQFDVAIDLANVAAGLLGQQKLDDAYAMFSKSLELRQKLSASDPMDALAKGRVGFALMRLATIDTQLARYPSAVAHAREAVRIQESIAATTKDVQSRRELAQALYILGRAEAATGRRAAACAKLQQAARLFEALPAARSDSTYPELAARDAAACTAGRPLDGVGTQGR